ncbi:MAG TPA: DJ-1/PfpI family protein [Terriglobales bacterium]|jgi:putative intracellular protease/amidase/YHS domain-containing protein|nr:DJ-1/PfpI family protein [Terriglobales bacterium]
MNRRELLKRSAAFGFVAGIPLAAGKLFAGAGRVKAEDGTEKDRAADRYNPLVPPGNGAIPVAFVISDGAVVIDFAGPWEVFQDVHDAQGHGFFNLYTVAETTKPVTASAGLKIVPDYTFQTAPSPKVTVIPAQNGESAAMLEWIRKSARTADVTMSVCTGAYVLAKTGLLSGKAATTHHSAYSEFAMQFPDIQLKRGARFVEDGNLASSGGLSSGVDLALRVVERYYGRERAEKTADMMEYQGQGWLNPNSNQVYAKARVSTDAHPVCPVCEMDGDPALKSVYKGKNYYFCSPDHKEMFDKAPAKFAAAREQ